MDQQEIALQTFLTRARLRYGDTVDYSLVTKDHMNGHKSYVPLICNINRCRYGEDGGWTQTINYHLNGKFASINACQRCNGREPWTLKRLLIEGPRIYGTTVDYSLVREEHINNSSRSYIPLRCAIKDCGHEWSTTINNHISGGKKCPRCQGCERWTLEKILIEGPKKHSNIVDYSLIRQEHLTHGKESSIPLKCLVCEHLWSPTIHNHIVRGDGCQKCGGHAPWTLQRLLIDGPKIHPDRIDYSLIREEHVNAGVYSRIPVRCLIPNCGHQWWPTIMNNINNRRGCPKCNMSKGELECSRVLAKLGFTEELQHQLPSLPKRWYDHKFTYNERSYLIEFDGSQHFDHRFRNQTEKDLEHRQQSDILKTKAAIKAECYLIRIDYTQIDHVEYHITNALKLLNSSTPVYFSDTNLYKYISENIHPIRSTGITKLLLKR